MASKDWMLTDKMLEELLNGKGLTVNYKTTVTKSLDHLPDLLDTFAKKPSIVVGVHADADSYPNGKSVAEVAFYHEFGTSIHPERSFLRSTIDEKREVYEQFMNKQVDRVLLGKIKTIEALNLLGLKIETDVKKKIRYWKLIDTGQLIQSIRYVVREDDK